MRQRLICAALLIFTTIAHASDRTPVIVELFTSEGCSSCPPPDRLLTQLLAEQPVAGVEIIALSEHVDYWNSLGWKDPFSAAQFTARQSAYGNSFTPEMVVDGVTSFVGNDRAQALSAIADSGRRAKTPVTVTAEGLKLHITVQAGEPAEIFLAVAENNLWSDVARGENKGSRLSHVAVVRKLSSIGRVNIKAGFSSNLVVNAAREWKRDDLRAVIFVQSTKSHRILSASSVSLK